MLFHDHAAAAAHVGAIWERAEVWWSETEVVGARREFSEVTLEVGADWLPKWQRFLKSFLE